MQVSGPSTVTPVGNGFFSMEKAISNLEQVLGRLPDSVRDGYMGEQSRTHGDLTELLISKAPTVVPNIITGLLLNTYISPFTSILLPIRQLGPFESLNVQWNELNFDSGLAPQVEVEGLARLYTHNKTKRGATAVRRGVAVKQEAGFFMSPEGREEWRQQIEQLATIVQRTNDYQVMMALLQTPMKGARHASELAGPRNVYGSQGHLTFEDRLKLEVDWFGIVNKSEDSRGFSNLVTALRTAMAKQGVNPDAMVLPPNLIGYYMGSKPDLWEYCSAGAENQANRKVSEDIGNESGIRTQVFQGMKLIDTHISRLAAGDMESPQDLLTVAKQIGEFYPMLTQNSFIDTNSFKNYLSRYRSIKIFNEDHGRLVPIRFSDCVQNCLRWQSDEDGHLNLHHSDERVVDDLFTFNYHDTARSTFTIEVSKYWCDMELENLTDESLDNVVSSILGKIPEESIKIAQENISAFFRFADPNNATSALNKGGTQKKFDSSPQYKDARKHSLDDCWKYIVNHLLSYVLGGFADSTVIHLDTVKFYLLTEDSNLDVTSPEFKNSYQPWNFNKDQGFFKINENSRDHWSTYLEKKNEVERLIAYTFLMSEITRENMKSMDRKDFYVPVDFVLMRPWMTYNVSSAIVMKAGAETGETVIGDQKFELTSNVSDRTIYGNYYYYSSSFVKKDRSVIVAPSIFIQNYIKGNNTTFVTSNQIDLIRSESGLLEDHRSLVAVMTRVNDPVADSNVLDIRGHREGLTPPNERKSFYSTAQYYNSLFNIESSALDDPVTQWQDYEEISIRANSICFLGHTETAAGEVIYRNTGHLGPVMYDGVQMSRKPGHYAPIRSLQSR